MPAVPHRIRRLCWDVAAPSRDEAFAIRARLRQMHEDDLLPEFCHAFDAAVPGEAVVHIPRLEVTVRIADLSELRAVLATALRRAMAERQVSTTPRVVESALASIPFDEDSQAPGAETARALASFDVVQALIRYLLTGTLPWPLRNLGRARTLSLLSEVAQRQIDRIADAAPTAIDRRAIFFLRWLPLLEIGHWEEVARAVERRASSPTAATIRTSPDVRAAIGGVVAASAGIVPPPPSRVRAAAVLLAIAAARADATIGARALRATAVSSHSAASSVDAFVATLPDVARRWLIDQFESAALPPSARSDARDATRRDESAIPSSTPEATAPERPVSTARPRQGVPPPPPSAPPAAKTTTERERRDFTVPATPLVPPAPGPDARARQQPPHGADVPGFARPSTPELPSPARHVAHDDDVEALDVAVDFAGLVLLHPFLPRFFERTHVVRTANDAALAPEALARAAALLSYAARGVDDPFEFELGFVKVLLGLRNDTELPVIAGSLTPEDCVEVDELLASVVEHWRVLKHTSVAGLRSAFLQRPGLLAEAEDRTWRLRVEPNAFDVLLDHLPWSIGTVKLPWMTKPLFTEWTTP